MLELTISLATPIVKAVLENFYGSAGEKLGEKAAELVSAKVKQLGQLIWDKHLRRKQGADEIVQNAANGSAEAQKALAADLHKTLEADVSLKQEVQPLVTEIIQNIQNNVDAKNVQQIFGGQGLMVNATQEQPIFQIQGTPIISFGGKSKVMDTSPTTTILMLSANPKGTQPLRLDEERREIEAGLMERSRLRDQFRLITKVAVRPRDCQRAMLDHNPQVVHFSGHGSGEQGIALEDEAGNLKLVDTAALAALFELYKDTLQCVVLNACYSEVQAEAIVEHIPYAIGMSDKIKDRAAIDFAVAFYDALGAGRNVEFAYKNARVAIQMAGISQSDIPVLHQRDISNPSLLSPSTPVPSPSTAQKESTESTITWQFVLSGTLDGFDQNRLKAIVNHLRELSGDTSLTLKRLEQGSIVLVLESTEEGFKVIKALFESGQLNEILGLPINSISKQESMEVSNESPRPLNVFISYSHRDEDFKDDLVVHLATLKRQGKIKDWQDRDIEAGAEWNVEIQQQLESADIILLLITPRFLASDYCYDLEMQRAVQRHDEGTARVIPLIVKPCDWQGTPFSKLQVLPKDAKPITKWGDPDEAFLNVVQGIRRAVEALHAKKPLGATAEAPAAAVPHPSAGRTPTVAAALPANPASSPFSTYNPATFAGRDTETAALTTLLQGNCRIIAIVGMTGIGKTALGERVVATLMETPHPQSLSQREMDVNPAPLLPGEKGLGDEGLPYRRFSLDDRSLTPDFSSSGAALLRELGEEPTLADQQDPANLVGHILARLRSHPCRLQIDSLERLLRGNEQEGWSEFCDPLWLDLLTQCLAANDSPSQLLLTSQDIPADLDTAASRYPQFWHYTPLQGLSTDEQRTLFQNLGLIPTDTDWEILQRIGAFYDGHPLVLQVITEEIRQPPFSGNIARYWQHYEAEFTAVPAVTAHKLDRSRLFRRRVRQRVEQSIQRLPEPARQMLCASAVFRRPVPIDFWYAMLPNSDPQAAFDTLQDRHLVEYVSSPNDPLLIRQHNLIRSVAYALLKADNKTWEAAERQAAHLWLTEYKAALDAPNLETVRGYLEAFDHYCEMGDWEEACAVLDIQIDSPTKESLHWQLETWGYYQEEIRLYKKVVGKTSPERDVLWFRGFGIAYSGLGNYSSSTQSHQQSLKLAQTIGDKNSEAKALGNLGNAYNNLGQYERAIDLYQQRLTIAREIGDRRGEGSALGNLGNAYNRLGQYERAIDLYQQHLTIAREIGDRQGEGASLGNLGSAYYSLGQYERAIDFYQQRLTIAREIGDRQGEGIGLENLGGTLTKLGRYSEALESLEKALALDQEIGFRSGEAETLKNLAELHQALDDVALARQYCEQALALATELGIPLKAECEALLQALETGEG